MTATIHRLPKARVSTAAIVETLKGAACPLTTLEVAAQLKANVRIVSMRLSKLADYGMIGRTKHTEAIGNFHTTYCLWSAPHA